MFQLYNQTFEIVSFTQTLKTYKYGDISLKYSSVDRKTNHPQPTMKFLILVAFVAGKFSNFSMINLWIYEFIRKMMDIKLCLQLFDF